MIQESERDFQKTVIELAQVLGWRVAHFRPARTKYGWKTAVAADGAGYPDLSMVRERIIFAELKAEKGKVSAEQQEWLEAIEAAGGEAYVWRPSDWNDLQETLTRRGR